MQMRAMKACFLIAECSLSYAKIMQMSAMKACFLIAECSLSYANIVKNRATTARRVAIFCIYAVCAKLFARLLAFLDKNKLTLQVENNFPKYH